MLKRKEHVDLKSYDSVFVWAYLGKGLYDYVPLDVKALDKMVESDVELEVREMENEEGKLDLFIG